MRDGPFPSTHSYGDLSTPEEIAADLDQLDLLARHFRLLSLESGGRSTHCKRHPDIL